MRWGAWAVPAFAALLLTAVAACGGEDAEFSAESGLAAGSPRPAPTAAPAATPAPAPTPAPAAQESDAGGAAKVRPAPLAQNRIIVHTARMVLVVEDVAETLDNIADAAHALGGWVVNSDRSSKHTGSIAVRVPAQALDEAFVRLEALALEVETRAVTSEDVTDEYVDNQSRLGSLRATEQRLLSFLDRADEVEDALLVQKEISELQQQIEAIQGRLNFLEQTAAYSLIEVDLKLSAETLRVDAGGDMAVRVGEAARFRASFWAPPDIDEVSFVWDFGDGAVVSGRGSIVRPDGSRITATVNHTYTDDRDSPYIVSVHLSAAGEGGIGEGSDSLEVAVSHVPTIEVFAGEDRTVEEGDKQDYNASFLRHAELWDYEYQWDFGDGSPTVTGEPEEGTTRVETTHTFSDYRSRAYEAVLTVSAMSDAGRVSGSDSFVVRVTESKGFLLLGWDIGGTAKGAIQVLLAIVSVAVRVIIWVAILSPVIVVVGVAIYLLNRYGQRNRPRRWPPPPGPESATAEPPPTDEDAATAPEEPPTPEEEPATADKPLASEEGSPMPEEERPAADGEPPPR